MKFVELIRDIEAQLYDELHPAATDEVDPLLVQQRFRFIQYLKNQLASLVTMKQQEERILAQYREQLRKAHIQKKTLDILEEKQRRRYVQSLQAQEEKELEDLVMARRSRTP